MILGQRPASGSILNSPGRVVGHSYYDCQANGSVGNRIVLDNLGGVHYSWTGSSSATLSPRYLYYGFLAETGDSLPAERIDQSDQDGFSAIDIFRGAIDPLARNSAVVAYHNSSRLDDRFAMDSDRGTGSFSVDSTGFPAFPGDFIWPNFSVDFNDNIQAVATESDVAAGGIRRHIYARRAFGSSNWTTPLVFDSTYCISPVITSSRISSKSAIVWTTPTDQDLNEYDNDVAYLQSSDGVSWNVPSGIANITGYPQSAEGDTTLRAYTDVDAVYDFGDELHVIWNVSHVTRDNSNEMVVLYHASLYHWSPSSGTSLIYDHPVREWPCDMGAWNLPISKMSIGVDPDSNFLYVIFTRFDPSDYAAFDTVNGDPNPCGGDNAMPCANGEIYLTWSRDGGNTWAVPENITNSPSPGCFAGNCDNDNWGSLAEVVDDYLHILYVDDKDAGSAAVGEGDITNNPVVYLALPNPTRQQSGPCQYVVGDINGNGVTNGVDVTFGVNYFKGGAPPPYQCECLGHGFLYVAGDVNNTCSFNGIDITYFVNYLKGGSPLTPCGDCPPAR